MFALSGGSSTNCTPSRIAYIDTIPIDPGPSLGLGGWLSPNVALTARSAGVTYSEGGASLTEAFIGPSLQCWVDDDLRVGYTFNPGTENTFNASFELNPAFFSENGSDATFTSIGFLFGYQYL